MGALSFTSPLILLGLLSLPAIWWLLRASPPSPLRQRFPAFLLLRRLTDTRQTPQRTPWWLLVMRLALAAFIITGLAGPVLNAPPKAPGEGPIILFVDNSFASANAWRARRDAMLAAASQAEQNDRPLYIIPTAPDRAPVDAGPLTPESARAAATRMRPQPFFADRLSALGELETIVPSGPLEIRWLADGVAGEADRDVAARLAALGEATLVNDPRTNKPVLRPSVAGSGRPTFIVERLRSGDAWEGDVIALARDGRELARVSAALNADEKRTEVAIDLPLAITNDLASVRLDAAPSAGAVQLIDARDRRALVGLVSETQQRGDRLLAGTHYIKQALGPFSAFVEDDLSEILESDASVIVLNDVGAIRPSQADALTAWVQGGGVLIRFAGPLLAEAAQDAAPPLLPVALRGGGRAFGGALTWETPQTIGEFAAGGPFAELSPPSDVFVRQQVLAEPGGETTERTWARLQDGTPLVTGEVLGQGYIALIHVAATPEWSDLPISGIFVDMLRRLAFLSAVGPAAEPDDEAIRYPPLRLLDGFGRFERPAEDDPALTARDLAQAPGPERRPGLYGAPDAALALNLMRAETPYAPLSAPGLRATPYEATPPQKLAPPLFATALVLLLADAIATLMLSGKFSIPSVRRAAGGLGAIWLCAFLLNPEPAFAQPLDRSIDGATIDAALTARLAYVETGDAELDRLSEQGLAGLSRELYRRTAFEPGPPAGINLETDDLAVYSFLYWPVAPGAEEPSEEALSNIENFMRLGGLILFDTRDDERAVGPGSTPEAQALQRIVGQLNIPPLTPVTSEHVLIRSFYLLSDGLYGRMRNNPVWVAADSSGANDGVTPVIIGGRDWTGAWAIDSFGRPLRAMPFGGEQARELAYRAGVNMVMVAFTGNYKSDQVHAPILLERLGR
ncbi:MAG: DUF4159 domain-containing protein [Pseudomonadota bacterium]